MLRRAVVLAAALLTGCGAAVDPPAPQEVVPVPEPAAPTVPEPAPPTVSVYLVWLPHPDGTVVVYRIFSGPTLQEVVFIRQVPAAVTQAAFEVSALVPTCFSLTAVNADGESPLTAGTCFDPVGA